MGSVLVRTFAGLRAIAAALPGLLCGAVAAHLCSGSAQASDGRFPFSIQGSRFLRDGVPVHLNGIGYQPLEPGQGLGAAISEARVLDDLRRFCSFQGGLDPIVLRVYAQPTPQFPARMPPSFYDGMRRLGFWVARDIYFDTNYDDPNAVTRGRAKVDSVISEVDGAGGLDRIFAWEIGNEFTATTPTQVSTLVNFVCAMRDHIKMRMAEPGRETFSNWVTWGSWPPADPLRTDGTPVLPGCLDFSSYNAYSYDPERIRDHQTGPGTGTPFSGYLSALKEQLPAIPLVNSETGLPDSPLAEGLDQPKLPPLRPAYRRGGLTGDQVAEGLADRYWDGRLSGALAGLEFFEWNDEWWKSGDPATHGNGPEEWFGISRFDINPIEARFKLQQETVRDLISMEFPASTPILAGVRAESVSVPSTGSTTLHADVAPGAVPPLRFRWESSRGYVTGDSDTVQFYAGGGALGPARVTVIGIDAGGRATSASVSIDIQPQASARLEVLTSGSTRAAGRAADVDLEQYKVALYVETDQQYIQPFLDMRSIWIGPEMYWWTTVHNSSGSAVRAWLIPKTGIPPATLPRGTPPAGTIASATMAGVNDTDDDLLPDSWERACFPDLSQGRYDDPDGDGLNPHWTGSIANNLDEFLAGTSPCVADNDLDADGLPDTWERRYFGRLAYGSGDDPEGDGLDNQMELMLGTHPGRTAADRDRDGLPDTWEIRMFGDLSQGFADDPDGDGVSNLEAYEMDLSPNGAALPGEVGSTVGLTHDGSTGTTRLSWVTVRGASEYNTYRGTIPATLMSFRMPPYDHSCYESDDSAGDGPTMSTDASSPPAGTAFYYIIAPHNACSEGSLGTAADGTIRPNPSPCPALPFPP